MMPDWEPEGEDSDDSYLPLFTEPQELGEFEYEDDNES